MQEITVDLNIRLWTIGFTLFNAVILFLIMRKFLFKPVNSFIENRKASIKSEIENAANIKGQALEFKAEFESKMANINNERAVIINDARKRGDEIYHKFKTDGEKERERILKNAETETDLMVEKAKEELRKETVTLSIDIAQQLIKKELDTDTNRKMVDSIINDLSAMQV